MFSLRSYICTSILSSGLPKDLSITLEDIPPMLISKLLFLVFGVTIAILL